MTNGPGPPMSPHDDSGAYESRPVVDPYPSGDGNTRPEDGSAGWHRPAPGPGRQPTQPLSAPGYSRGRAAGGPTARGQGPSSLAQLTGLRRAGDRRTEIARGSAMMKIGIW